MSIQIKHCKSEDLKDCSKLMAEVYGAPPYCEKWDINGSVAKNKITLLPTIIRFNFSQSRFTCSTENGSIFQAITFLNTPW